MQRVYYINVTGNVLHIPYITAYIAHLACLHILHTLLYYLPPIRAPDESANSRRTPSNHPDMSKTKNRYISECSYTHCINVQTERRLSPTATPHNHHTRTNTTYTRTHQTSHYRLTLQHSQQHAPQHLPPVIGKTLLLALHYRQHHTPTNTAATNTPTNPRQTQLFGGAHRPSRRTRTPTAQPAPCTGTCVNSVYQQTLPPTP